MPRIAVGGFHHETNTFAPTKAGFSDFVQADGWPELTRGPGLPDRVAGMNLGIAGFVPAARALGHEVVPLLWCSANPSAHVTDEAFERIAAMFVEDLGRHMLDGGPFDAVYLDLHGAMVTESLEDGEGELLRRVRAVVGPDVPLVVSLDLHANVTRAMVERATTLIAYRHYPHTDMAETGERAAGHLDALLRGRAHHKAFRKLPYLIPITWQCTLMEPARSIYAMVAALEDGGVTSVSFATGFPPADIHDCGPAILAYGQSAAAAETAAERLLAELLSREKDFAGKLYGPDEAVRYAMGKANRARGPIVIADTQDNPGAGGSSDTTGMLEALIRNRAEGAVIGSIHDPETAMQAHAAGEGAVIAVRLGGKAGIPGHRPLEAEARVERLGSGSFTASGPMWRGSRVQIGPMTLLSIDGVRVVVASRKMQAADQSIFRHLGIEPPEQKILVLKSSVHFRADFQPIAEEIIVAEAPGANLADHLKLPYRRLREGVRLTPLGPERKASPP